MIKLPGPVLHCSMNSKRDVWLVSTFAQDGGNPSGGWTIFHKPRRSSGFRVMPGWGYKIQCLPDGRAFLMNARGRIFEWRNGWYATPDVSLDIAFQDANTGYSLIPSAGTGIVEKWSPAAKKFVRFGGEGRAISVDPSGAPWVVNKFDEVWHFESGKWRKKARFSGAIDLAVTPDNRIWVLLGDRVAVLDSAGKLKEFFRVPDAALIEPHPDNHVLLVTRGFQLKMCRADGKIISNPNVIFG